jgi:hypothetical protein
LAPQAAPPPLIEPEDWSPTAAISETAHGRSRKAVAALLLGGLAVPLSLLALVPGPWMKAPATLAGIAGLLLALLAMNEIKQSRGRQTGMPWALAGLLSALTGLFLAPTLISRMGQRLHDESTREYTETHLREIGVALNRYHDAHGAFPSGGIFLKQPPGPDLRLHGWMTQLLPYLGEESLFRQIDQALPFDHPNNLPAMSTNVPVFFAAGADRSKVGGFGVAHFAGVGGEVVDENGGYAEAGLFGINSRVARESVVDGLSNTLAAGEIAVSFPAWGDPENWRVIGRGLNRDVLGFGNARQTGACFLMADGSVRFFSNSTDLRLLTSLSTRNGGERVDELKLRPAGSRAASQR